MENGISQGGQHPTLHGLPNNSSKPHPNILQTKLYGSSPSALQGSPGQSN